MKFLALLALALPLSAWSVDYSRCNFPFEVQVDPEGAVTPSSWYQASDIRTEGNRTTMTLRPKSQFTVGGPQSEPKRIVIERDDQGRITSITSGGERPSDATIRQYRQMQSSPYGGYVAGVQGGYGGGVTIGAQFGLGDMGTYGFLVPVRRNGSTQMVKTDQLSDTDLQQIGVKGITAAQLQTGAKEHNRDARTQTALRQIQDYSKNNFPFSIPVGSSHQYTFVDGACMPDKISSMSYSSTTDRVESQTYYDREDCQHVKTGWERHSAKVNECRAYDNNQIAVEYNRLVADGHIQPSQGGYVGGLVGGMQGGYVAGSVGGGLGGGTANTSGSGYGSGSGAGYGGFNPMAMGGSMSISPYGGWGGSPRENLESNYHMCQMYERSWNQGLQGSSIGPNFGTGGATQY